VRLREIILLRWLTAVALASFLSGCSQKNAPPAPPAEAAAPSQPETASNPAARPAAAQPQPVVVADGADNAAVLSTLTQALRKYSFEHNRVPKSFSELIAAGYVKNLPSPPAGKQYGIDAKTVSVILVSP
jgi:predicted small lipoprotein YifL